MYTLTFGIPQSSSGHKESSSRVSEEGDKILCSLAWMKNHLFAPLLIEILYWTGEIKPVGRSQYKSSILKSVPLVCIHVKTELRDNDNIECPIAWGWGSKCQNNRGGIGNIERQNVPDW